MSTGTGVEVGTAYLSLTVEAKQLGQQISQQLNDAQVDKIAGQVGDDSGKAFGDEFEKRSSSSFKRIGETAAGFLSAKLFEGGVTAISGFVSGSVEQATALGESVNAVNKIFGDSSQQILDWGKQNATSFGLSQASFNQLATPLGALLKNQGIEDFSGQTIELTKRAADLASVFNVDVSTALEAINSGLKGEADPLEQFGVGVSAAKVEAQALADTGKTLASELTDQEIAQGRLNLIMKESASVAGDFTDTSDQYANAQRIAAAKTEEMQAAIGQKLIPVFAKVTQVKLALVNAITTYVIPAFERVVAFVRDELVPRFQSFGSFLAEHKEILIGVGVGIVATLVPAFVAWAASALSAAAATLAAIAPVIAVGAAIAALVAGVIWAYQNWDWFRTAVDAVASFLTDKVWPAIKVVADALIDALGWAIGHVRDLAERLWPTIRTVGEWIGRNLATSIGAGVDAVKGIINWFAWLIDAAANVYNGVKGWFDSLVGFFSGLPGTISSAVTGLFDGIKDAFRSAVNWIIDKWNGLSFGLPSFDTKIPGIGKVGGFDIGTYPKIPRLATGGVIDRPTLALVGETQRARPEIVTPERLMRSVFADELDQRGRGDVSIENHFHNARVDANEAARALAWELRATGVLG